jgi:hypothetical protein
MGIVGRLVDIDLDERVSKHLTDEFERFCFNPEENVEYENVCQRINHSNGVYFWPIILRKSEINGKILSLTYLKPVKI